MILWSGLNPESSNYAKFQTRNPVARRLIDRFYDRLRSIVEPLGTESVLDAGCGEGETLARLSECLPQRISAVDASPEAVEFTARRFPSIDVARGDVRSLSFADGAFDLVLCLEVLEHVDDPGAAVGELARVTREHLVISVPHEPWFRLGSAMRGKYLRTLGNHPEHVNHWGERRLERFLGAHLVVVSVARAFPWLIAHCQPAQR
ncbi:MAG: class I SAM-dependent methyltransferase [Solirubrobacterales bacterium]